MRKIRRLKSINSRIGDERDLEGEEERSATVEKKKRLSGEDDTAQPLG